MLGIYPFFGLHWSSMHWKFFSCRGAGFGQMYPYQLHIGGQRKGCDLNWQRSIRWNLFPMGITTKLTIQSSHLAAPSSLITSRPSSTPPKPQTPSPLPSPLSQILLSKYTTPHHQPPSSLSRTLREVLRLSTHFLRERPCWDQIGLRWC